ncbi:DUF7167 family protein [Lysinibacillus sp. TE18511]
MRKVHFSVSMNVQGAYKERTYTFEELGIDETPAEELEEAIGEAYNEWVWDQLSGGFEVIDN